MRNIAPKDAADLDAVEPHEWLESLDYVLQTGGPVKVARLLRDLRDSRHREGRQAAILPPTHPTSIPFPLTTRCRCPAVPTSSAASRAWSAGTPWRWWCGPTRRTTASAVTSRRMRRPPRSTKSASIISSAATTAATATSIFFQGHAAPGIYARAFLEGRPRTRRDLRTSAATCPPAAGCRRIRIRG